MADVIFPPSWERPMADETPHATSTSEYLFGGPGGADVVNKSTDFMPRWDGATMHEISPLDELPPPAPPPSLPPMHQGELRDMLHAATLHILDLERRVAALEPKP